MAKRRNGLQSASLEGKSTCQIPLSYTLYMQQYNFTLESVIFSKYSVEEALFMRGWLDFC